MSTTADTARFRSTDPDELVMASLACPVCLQSSEVEWKAVLEAYDHRVDCSCERCARTWPVYLTPQQALRLVLMASGA